MLCGKITKKPCVVCGETKVDGHHPDYSKPYEIIWLCRKHHGETWRKYYPIDLSIYINKHA